MQLILYSKCLCLTLILLTLVYSLFVPSQPVISQPDAVLMPNLATLIFWAHKCEDIIQTKKNLALVHLINVKLSQSF